MEAEKSRREAEERMENMTKESNEKVMWTYLKGWRGIEGGRCVIAYWQCLWGFSS